jgi:hypothetical protein
MFDMFDMSNILNNLNIDRQDLRSRDNIFVYDIVRIMIGMKSVFKVNR